MHMVNRRHSLSRRWGTAIGTTTVVVGGGGGIGTVGTVGTVGVGTGVVGTGGVGTGGVGTGVVGTGGVGTGVVGTVGAVGIVVGTGGGTGSIVVMPVFLSMDQIVRQWMVVGVNLKNNVWKKKRKKPINPSVLWNTTTKVLG